MFDCGDVGNTDLWYNSFLSKPDRTVWTSTRVQLCRVRFRQAQRPDGKRVKPLHLMQPRPLALVRPVVLMAAVNVMRPLGVSLCFGTFGLSAGINGMPACVNLTVLHTHRTWLTTPARVDHEGLESDVNYTKGGTEQTTFNWQSFKVQLTA